MISYRISCFLIFEMITVFIMACLSFSVSVVISVGLSLSCRQLRDPLTKYVVIIIVGSLVWPTN